MTYDLRELEYALCRLNPDELMALGVANQMVPLEAPEFVGWFNDLINWECHRRLREDYTLTGPVAAAAGDAVFHSVAAWAGITGLFTHEFQQLDGVRQEYVLDVLRAVYKLLLAEPELPQQAAA